MYIEQWMETEEDGCCFNSRTLNTLNTKTRWISNDWISTGLTIYKKKIHKIYCFEWDD